jgi:hypothetical protein
MERERVCHIGWCTERAVAVLDVYRYCFDHWSALMFVLEDERRKLHKRPTSGLSTLGEYFNPTRSVKVNDGKSKSSSNFLQHRDLGDECTKDQGEPC